MVSFQWPAVKCILFLESFGVWDFSLLLALSTEGRSKETLEGKQVLLNGLIPARVMVSLIRDKGGDLFVHLRSVQSQDRRKLKENTRVRYSVENTEKGPQAENIRII